MTCYGFMPTPADDESAWEINKYVDTIEPDSRGLRPYVEANGLYQGVWVRRLTHYPEQRRIEIQQELDRIYKRVIEGEE